MIEFLMVADAPTPVAPFSHATAAGGWLFVTGQMPTDPADDSAPLPDGIEAQLPSPLASRDRACPGHPRLLGIDCSKKDVDARHKAGHGAIHGWSRLVAQAALRRQPSTMSRNAAMPMR